jgi:hypothetical protein
MLHPNLNRDYFFEFAGMPQSGKSTVEEIVAHYLKRTGYTIGQYRGGSKYSPLLNAPIDLLNLSLANGAVDFMVNSIGREKGIHKIFLLDRGIIDRCMFTEALHRKGKIDERTARSTKDFLTLDQLTSKVDGVFVFITSPESAMVRENENKLVQTEGGVMNEDFLETMRSAVMDEAINLASLIPGHNVVIFNTEDKKYKGKEKIVAREIVDNIMNTIHKDNEKIPKTY